jgi:4-hydroxy-tetrahydrodipicolinate synthase
VVQSPQPKDAKQWAKENLNGIITGLIPTFTLDMRDLNEKAIAFDIERTEKQGFHGFSIITEAGTTYDENKRLIDICVKHAKGRLLTVLLTTFPTLDENFEMVSYAASAGVDMIQLGYPAMWRPRSIEDVVRYTKEICAQARIPIILWAAEMWGWCGLLEDPSNYPIDLLRKCASIENVVAIKAGTRDPIALKEIYSMGIIPGTVSEPLWPLWIRKYNAQWGGISAYNHLYFCAEYFSLLRRGEWEQGMELYFRMLPIRELWSKLLSAEVGGSSSGWGWTGHNRLRWKYAAWLAGCNGGPLRGSFRIASSDMQRIRQAMMASNIPVTKDPDQLFFEGRNPS